MFYTFAVGSCIVLPVIFYEVFVMALIVELLFFFFLECVGDRKTDFLLALIL